MNKKVISYDLGTGGVKASVYNQDGIELENSFVEYDTYYPKNGWHEQKPEEWWDAIVKSTENLLKNSQINSEEIVALAISGHSLGVIPIGFDGELLRDSTPIWSDTRALKEADEYFKTVNYENWYYKTGAGFPAHLYSIFKIMWYKNNEPEMFKKIKSIIGTKDYINYKMTNVLGTDNSYASGTGIYSLTDACYNEEFIKSSGIDPSILPPIFKSTDIMGTLSDEAAKILKLPNTVKVACGGVDNSCMALGAKGIADGRVYTSLGSSAWIAVTSSKPIVDFKVKSYVFAHIIPGMFASATAIFSAGNSHKWAVHNLLPHIDKSKCYKEFDNLAKQSPVGSNNLIFNPSLAGGSGLDKSPNIRGAYLGLDLNHTNKDMARSTLEGIAISLRIALDTLKTVCSVSGSMLIVGGGTKSPLWMQIFADSYKMDIVETNVGQGTGSLGAAAIACVAVGIWDNFDKIDEIHKVLQIRTPIVENSKKYDKMIPIFVEASDCLSDIGDKIAKLHK